MFKSLFLSEHTSVIFKTLPFLTALLRSMPSYRKPAFFKYTPGADIVGKRLSVNTHNIGMREHIVAKLTTASVIMRRQICYVCKLPFSYLYFHFCLDQINSPQSSSTTFRLSKKLFGDFFAINATFKGYIVPVSVFIKRKHFGIFENKPKLFQ